MAALIALLGLSKMDCDEQGVSMRVHRRHLRDVQNPFEMTTDDHFVDLYRFPKSLCLKLIDELMPYLPTSQRIHAIPSHIRVLSALRFFASGSFQRSVGQDKLAALSQTSVSRCVKDVSSALNKISCRHIKFPKREEFAALKMKFIEEHQFPGVIGLIDGTHIKICAPNKQIEHVYFCPKGGHSKNVMIICDADCIVLSANAQFGGSTCDAHVWQQCRANKVLEEIYSDGERNFWLLGDSGYPIEPWLMTPFSATLSACEESFNKALKSARVPVERCIGLIKSRFRCLSGERVLFYSPLKAGLIINACLVLHNYLVRAKVPFDEIKLDSEPHDNSTDFLIGDKDKSSIGMKQRLVIVRKAFT